MIDSSDVKLIIKFNDPELEPEVLDRQAQNLLTEFKVMKEVISAYRVPEANTPSGSKAFGSFIIGLLTAEINIQNAKQLLLFLGKRLHGKPIELEVKANGRSLKVKVQDQKELEAAIQAARDFIEA